MYEKAVGVLHEHVPRAEPSIAKLLLRLVGQIGVAARLRRMLHPEHALPIEADLDSGERPAGARAVRGSGRRDHAGTECLGHAVEVEQFAANRLRPVLDELRRKPLATGDEAAHRAEGGKARAGLAEKAPVDGRHAEQGGRLVSRDDVDHGFGIGPVGEENRARAERQRAEQRVLQAVGEKQLRGSEHAVTGADADFPEGLAKRKESPVRVQDAFWLPRRARCVQAECGRIRQRIEGERFL